MSNPTPKQIITSINKAIQNAQRNYKDAAWTPLCYCPEYFITTNVFYSLLKLAGKESVTLESKPNDLLWYLNKKKPKHRRPQIVPRGNGHIDICLWNVKDGMPRVIIEVKRCAEDWIPDIREDIKRIRNLLTKKTRRKLTFGILASCIHREVKNNNRRDLERDIESKLAEIQQAIEGKLGNELVVKLEPSRVKPLRLKYSVDSNDWIWQPVVFNVYR